MNEVLQKLKDIKPPVEVPDNSLWLLVALLALLMVAAGALFWFLKRGSKKRKRRRKDPVEIAKSKLGEIDFKDTKRAVYTFDEFFPVVAAGDPELMEEFQKLFEDLQRYKYKKEVPPLQKEDRERIEALIKRVVS